MKIQYDKNLKIAGIGLVPWSRLGPEKWLDSYSIASLYGWDMPNDTDLPSVWALGDQVVEIPHLPKLNTQHLIRLPDFQNLLDHHLPGYDLLTYKPVEVPPALSDRKFLMVDPQFTNSFENKAWLREKFAEQVTFPAFAVYSRDELPRTRRGFDELMAGRPKVVLQDEQLSGGKGTFIIGDYDRYQWALSELEQHSSHTRVVVSDAIPGPTELSIQACITKHGIFTGPLQRQVIAHPLLANLDVSSGDKFCGIEIRKEDQETRLHQQAIATAQVLARAMQAEGYKGIFGVDLLLGSDGELYLLEINPRLTGATPLLTALDDQDKNVPFYLLHLLELGSYPYEILDNTAAFSQEGSLLMLHSMNAETVSIESCPASGTYVVDGGTLKLRSRSMDVADLRQDECIVQQYVPPQMHIKPGGRLAVLFFKRPVIDLETNKLYNDVVEIIETVKKQIITKVTTGSGHER